MSENQRDIERIGAYVLGLSSPEEGEQLERELQQRADLRALHAELTDQFQDLNDTAEPVAASDSLWSRIEADLSDERPVAAAAPAKARHDDGYQEIYRPAPAGARRFGFWRGFTAAAFVASLGFAILAIRPELIGLAPPPPVVIAVLLDDQNEPGAVVEAFDGERIKIVPLRDFEVPEGRILQVWTKPNEEIGPVSLGVLPENTQMRLEGPDLPEPQPAQLYEVTLEPAPGSPTGLPTGPILLKGFAKTPL
ncbi:MAG: anti-sigma factor domain-containing protein [Geminicoccaceae bacterium]